MPDNNQERRPITIELNLNAVTLCDGESLPVSSQKGLQLNLASEDFAIDSGLKAVSLLERHSLPAHHTAQAASFVGSILLCNDYRHLHRHPRAPRAGEWSMCKLISLGQQSYARIAPHKTGFASVPHRPAMYWPVLIRGGGGASVLSR